MLSELKVEILKKYGTQFDFADAVGDNFTFVSMVLNHRRWLSEEKAQRWESVLGVSREVLKPFIKAVEN